MPNANTYLPGVIVTPGFLLITNITKALQMVVSITDSTKNTYIVGQLVHLYVPPAYGMFQANELTGLITNISGTDFTLNINSKQFDTFVIPSAPQGKPASLAPAGSRNLEYSNSTNKVPFQDLNNIGN